MAATMRQAAGLAAMPSTSAITVAPAARCRGARRGALPLGGVVHAAPPRRRVAARAEDPASTSQDTAEAEEDRLEALEAAVKGRRVAKDASPPPPQQQRGALPPGPRRAQWSEGQLLPDGWDGMDPLQKTTELLYGDRGVLFWLNKLAWGSIIGLMVLWVLFRIVGPALGLYTLANDITTPSF